MCKSYDGIYYCGIDDFGNPIVHKDKITKRCENFCKVVEDTEEVNVMEGKCPDCKSSGSEYTSRNSSTETIARI